MAKQPSTLSISQLQAALKHADEEQLNEIERCCIGDERSGVRKALDAARKRIAARDKERRRLEQMYLEQQQLAGMGICIGLDEVGRGPLAGPLTVAGVILPENPRIPGLNDSKQMTPRQREEVAATIHEKALCSVIHHVPAAEIDARGMADCLRMAFSHAVEHIEEQGFKADALLLDGNPLGIDEREISIVKGDSRCACIAAASIIAKVARDALMVELDADYPEYGWARNKGYGTKEHQDALRTYGLTEHHRVSFCSGILQDSLFS